MDLKKFVKPLILEVWEQVLLPELKKLDGQIKSDDLKLVAGVLADALDKIVEAEVPRI